MVAASPARGRRDTPLASQKNQLATCLLVARPRRRRNRPRRTPLAAPAGPGDRGTAAASGSSSASLQLRIAEPHRAARASSGLASVSARRLRKLLGARPPARRPDSGVPARWRRCGRRTGRRNGWSPTPAAVKRLVRLLHGRAETPARRTTPPRPAAAPARSRPGPSSAAGPAATPARPAHRAPPARWETACSGSGARQRSTIAASILSTPRTFRWADGGGDCSIVCR